VAISIDAFVERLEQVVALRGRIAVEN
jgi:hypothetical protein